MTKNKFAYLPGIFDFFHKGHLHFIKECLEKFDSLLIGIYSDSFLEGQIYEGHPLLFDETKRYEMISNWIRDKKSQKKDGNQMFAKVKGIHLVNKN